MRKHVVQRAIAALALGLLMLAPLAQHTWPASAQDATPVPGAQTWHVQVNNISPEGENWSFSTFYPDYLQVHPGDSIEFTLAPNQQAFHTVHLLALGMTPMEFYQGFSGGFVQPDLTMPGEWERTYFGFQAGTPCGRAGQHTCNAVDVTDDISFGIASPVLVNAPPTGGDGNTSWITTIDPNTRPGPYYVLSDVDGPTMMGRIDVVPFDQPVQGAGELEARAARQYESDLDWLAGQDRIEFPSETSNLDGTKTWQVAAGGGGRSGSAMGQKNYSGDTPQGPQSTDAKSWLSINEFAPSDMVIIAGDTVTWTNGSPGAVPHTVSGFASSPDALPTDLDPFQPGCLANDGSTTLPPEGSFPPDIWNTCPGMEVNRLTEASQPSAASGERYVAGPRTSGILLNQAYLDSAIGAGLPFASSYSVTFEDPGTYVYECAIHPGMTGRVVVIPKPKPR
jgi:plastocyanin